LSISASVTLRILYLSIISRTNLAICTSSRVLEK
jgi:hypothetical protein